VPWLRAGALCARQLPFSMGLYDGLQGLGGGQPEMGGPVPFTALLSISNGMLLGPPQWGSGMGSPRLLNFSSLMCCPMALGRGGFGDCLVRCSFGFKNHARLELRCEVWLGFASVS
jgi:hypothetical protein